MNISKDILNRVLNKITDEDVKEFSGNSLLELVEKILTRIMREEREKYLKENEDDKANGNYKRSLNTSIGNLSIEVPRTRSGEFRSKFLPPKYQRYEDSFEELLFSLLINGDSKQEIIQKLKLRGLNFSEKAYDEIFEYIKNQFDEFKTRELEENYFFIYIDAYHCMAKDIKDKRVKKAVVYTVVGIDTNANKSLLGFYSFFGNENKSTWMDVLQDLINRGLKRVLMFISDDFNGISEAIKAYFPYFDIQKCLVHLQRNIIKNMKKEEFLAFLNYPETIRKLINNTNPVESVHSSFEKQRLRKGGFFQSMDTLNIALFIATDKLHQKWKLNPLIKSKIYELNQIFVKKFGLGIIR